MNINRFDEPHPISSGSYLGHAIPQNVNNPIYQSIQRKIAWDKANGQGAWQGVDPSMGNQPLTRLFNQATDGDGQLRGYEPDITYNNFAAVANPDQQAAEVMQSQPSTLSFEEIMRRRRMAMMQQPIIPWPTNI